MMTSHLPRPTGIQLLATISVLWFTTHHRCHLHHSSIHHTTSSPLMTKLDRPTGEVVYGWCLASSLVPWHYSTLPVWSGEFLGSCFFSALRRLVGEKGQQITSLTRGSCCLVEITAESCKSDFVRWLQYHTYTVVLFSLFFTSCVLLK